MSGWSCPDIGWHVQRRTLQQQSSTIRTGCTERRSYSIFHAIRAVNVLDGSDASKHSSVIAHFNRYHVHTGDFSKDTYKIIDSAYRIREKSDYSDFFIVTREEAGEQIKKEEGFISAVRVFLEESGKRTGTDEKPGEGEERDGMGGHPVG